MRSDLAAALRRETEDRFVETGATPPRARHRAAAGAGPPATHRHRRASNPWHALTADQAAREWPLLAEWIAPGVRPWGDIARSEPPDCWASHRPILVQLSWPRTAHIQAYHPRRRPGLAAE